MTNAPTFRDFIAEKLGSRDWYTRPRPAPARARGRAYISPKKFDAIAAEYADLFGVNARAA